MSTKNNPENWDCYAKAEPDEPMFVLLGRDPVAPVIVAFWVALRGELDGIPESDPKLVEAIRCAREMLAWAVQHGQGERARTASTLGAEVLLGKKESTE
jgi:hypothetical protein